MQIEAVEQLIEPSVTALGFRLVQVRLMGGASAPTLQVMAEPLGEREMDVDDCAELSRTISALLDVEDPIPGAYTLEVSSPGIDRPLVRLEDFERHAGFEAKIELRQLVDGRRRYSGRLLGTQDDDVLIRIADKQGEQTVAVPYGEIERAKLKLTDELIEATMQKRRN